MTRRGRHHHISADPTDHADRHRDQKCHHCTGRDHRDHWDGRDDHRDYLRRGIPGSATKNNKWTNSTGTAPITTDATTLLALLLPVRCSNQHHHITLFRSATAAFCGSKYIGECKYPNSLGSIEGSLTSSCFPSSVQPKELFRFPRLVFEDVEIWQNKDRFRPKCAPS